MYYYYVIVWDKNKLSWDYKGNPEISSKSFRDKDEAIAYARELAKTAEDFHQIDIAEYCGPDKRDPKVLSDPVYCGKIEWREELRN